MNLRLGFEAKDIDTNVSGQPSFRLLPLCLFNVEEQPHMHTLFPKQVGDVVVVVGGVSLKKNIIFNQFIRSNSAGLGLDTILLSAQCRTGNLEIVRRQIFFNIGQFYISLQNKS